MEKGNEIGYTTVRVAYGSIIIQIQHSSNRNVSKWKDTWCAYVFLDLSRISQVYCIAAFALKKYTFHCAISRLHYNAPLVGYCIRYKEHKESLVELVVGSSDTLRI